MWSKPPRALLLLAYLGFVSLGLPDAVLGIAWPSLRAEFGLSQAMLGWILGAFASGYVLSGLFAGRLLNALGVGTLLAGSTLLVVLGLAGYVLAREVLVFAAGALVVGFGSGAIDSGLNNYAAGHFPPRHMAWLHAAYSLGAALGSLAMAIVVAQGAGFRAGYTLVGGILALLAAGFVLTRDRWSSGAPRSRKTKDTASAGAKSGALAAASRGRVQLAALLFFVYSGVELGLGHWAYTVLTEGRGLAPDDAGLAVTVYWTSLLGGRVLAGFVVDRVGPARLVRIGTVVAAAGAALFAAPLAPFANAFGLALAGLALAPIYPGLMSETPRRMDAASVHAVGFQVSSATAGMVALPALGGWLADRVGLGATALLVLACALAVLLLNELLERLTGSAAAPRSD